MWTEGKMGGILTKRGANKQLLGRHVSIDEVSAQRPPPPNRLALHDSMSIAYNYNRHDYGFQLWSVIQGSPLLSPSMS